MLRSEITTRLLAMARGMARKEEKIEIELGWCGCDLFSLYQENILDVICDVFEIPDKNAEVIFEESGRRSEVNLRENAKDVMWDYLMPDGFRRISLDDAIKYLEDLRNDYVE